MSEKRLAVVTGGARGIGRAVVLELLKQGRTVAALDINAEQLTELEKAVKEAGFTVITECIDITNTDQLTTTLEGLAKEYGGIDRITTYKDVVAALLKGEGEDFEGLKENTNFFG